MNAISRLIDYLSNITNIITIASNNYCEKLNAITFSTSSLIIKSIGLFRYLVGDGFYYMFLAAVYIGIALLIFKVIEIIIDLISKVISILW